jgi:hypothetical protein
MELMELSLPGLKRTKLRKFTSIGKSPNGGFLRPRRQMAHRSTDGCYVAVCQPPSYRCNNVSIAVSIFVIGRDGRINPPSRQRSHSASGMHSCPD